MRARLCCAMAAVLLWALTLGQAASLCGESPSPAPLGPRAVICTGAGETPASGTLTVELGRPIRLTAKGSVGETIAWKVIPPQSEAVIMLDAVDKTGTPVLVVFPTEATPFYVELIAVKGGNYEAIVLTVTPRGPQPSPEPKPNPPQPGPVSYTIPAGHLWLIGVLPSLMQQTDSQGAIERSNRLLKLLDAKGNHFRWVDPQCAPAALAPFVSKAQADGLPRVLIVDDSPPAGSAIQASIPLTTETDVIKLVQQWGGE